MNCLPLTLVLFVTGFAVSAFAAEEEALSIAAKAIHEGRAAEAAVLYRDMAEEGDGAAQYNLALLYLTGRGVPQSHRDALFWAWRARLSGMAEAPSLIARMSEVTTPDLRRELAARLIDALQPRIDMGEGRAMLELAAVYLEVLPEPDLTQGLVWQALAAALEVPGADEARDTTGARLTADDRLTAESEAVKTLSDLCGKGLKGQAICDVMF